MFKNLMFSFIIIGLLSPNVFADKVLLKNGKVIEGNVLSVDDDFNVTISMVVDEKLTGMELFVDFEDIKDLAIDKKYEGLRKEANAGIDHQAQSGMILSRLQGSEKIDKKIRQRVEREKAYIRDLEVRQEDKRRFERELEHEKEMLVLETEMQKELIEFSKNAGVRPEVGVSNIKIQK